MLENWDNWTAGEREMFRSTCRRLMKHTFLVRDRDEDSRTRYFFISRSLDAFNEYLSYIGFEVRLDRDNGVAMLRSTVASDGGARSRMGHLTLKKAESLVLCCLWTLYADRLRSGSLKKGLAIRMSDLRLEMEKYGTKELVDKSTMQGILNLFTRYQLIGQKGKMGEDAFQIILYPSLQFALDRDAFLRLAGAAEKRMREEEPGSAGEEEDEPEELEETGESL